jgi:hypothetical protein
MYQTGTYSFPLHCRLLPPVAIILPIYAAYAVKLRETESLWELQVQSWSNGSWMFECIPCEQSFDPIAILDTINILIALATGQGKRFFFWTSDMHSRIPLNLTLTSAHIIRYLPSLLITCARVGLIAQIALLVNMTLLYM